MTALFPAYLDNAWISWNKMLNSMTVGLLGIDCRNCSLLVTRTNTIDNDIVVLIMLLVTDDSTVDIVAWYCVSDPDCNWLLVYCFRPQYATIPGQELFQSLNLNIFSNRWTAAKTGRFFLATYKYPTKGHHKTECLSRQKHSRMGYVCRGWHKSRLLLYQAFLDV